MRHKSIVITIVIVLLLVGCKKEDLPKEIRDEILFDELPEPIENRFFSVYVGPETVRSGEAIYIGVDLLRGRRNVYATIPDPNDKDNALRLQLERYKNSSVWLMPPSWLYADGRVAYGSQPNANDVVEGERAIYTPFDWDEDTVPIRVDNGNQYISFEVNVRGNLKENILIRPVGPRHPFPNGASPVWEEHLDIFPEIIEWWEK